MTLPLTPTTTLEAVNQCLFAIGEAPVNSVENSGLVDAVTALRTVANVNREVQASGWHWNTEKNFKLVPDNDGNLSLAANVMKVDTVGSDESLDLVQRGQRLYDRDNHTYTFTKSVTVEMVMLLDFEEIPEAARNYITLRAARRFQQNTVGSTELAGFQQVDEARALVNLQNAEAETQDFALLNSPGVREVLWR
jgi:hypothetical protein